MQIKQEFIPLKTLTLPNKKKSDFCQFPDIA